MSCLTRAAVALLFSCICAASPRAALELKTLMQDPDWIGPPVEAAWWQLDGRAYHYRVKRADSELRDVYRVQVESGEVRRIDAADRAGSDGPDPVFDTTRRRALTIRGASLYLRDLESGELRRLFTGQRDVAEALFAADGQAVLFRAGDDWWRVDAAGHPAVPLADLRFEDEPHGEPEGGLEADQLRLFATLERERARAAERQAAEAADAAAVRGSAPAPWYLGAGHRLEASLPSPDGRWMLLVVEKTGADEGRRDHMPHFVDRSGYVAVEDVRRLVGREPPVPQSLWLLDLAQRRCREIDLSGLAGRDVDPLAELKSAQGIEPHDADTPRPLTVNGMQWHPAGGEALLQLRAVDNKDRWTLRLDATSADVREVHRLTDSAWINWAFNDVGWVPGTDRIWLLSEESGFSHLYSIDREGRVAQHTRGDFEVSSPHFAADGRSVLLLANAAHPTAYDLYRVELADGAMERLTTLGGVESFAPGPRGERVLLRYSDSYLPPQAAVLDVADAALGAATDTRTAAYRGFDWQEPEFVAVPSSHVERPLWSKFYPARAGAGEPRPAVLFVHGAGYTQNTHHRFPYYFREQMFHNLLSERGYHVLDMDYRASRGYGRDWRTAIYRQMGTPELEDLVDGVRWLVEEQGADPRRIGVYGGSYGGFMTFMALFRAPEVFAAGAALRPVTDWRHYNHGYTSNILNTPQVDPEAHRRSSPIEFVEGLRGRLLISHGMLDDNVFYKDSVRLEQRLIELEKTGWELASYPLEAHAYRHPESWLDQYRRVLALFEDSIGAVP